MGTLFGIDPGNNGAIVALGQMDGEWDLHRVFRLSLGEEPIASFFRQYAENASEHVAYLEKVHGWGEGRSFNFGMYYGFVRGVLRAHRIRIVDVTPQKWMKAMGVPPQKGQKAAHRQAMREMAGAMQDEVSSTNWNAAAILIALYGLREETGQGLRHKAF